MHKHLAIVTMSWAVAACTPTEDPEAPPPPPVLFGPRMGGEEGMNCMGASYETAVAGPVGTVSIPTRNAVARFAEEIEVTVDIDGGARFEVDAPSFDPITQGTWREKFFQVLLPPDAAMAGEGPSGDLIAGHFDLGDLSDECLASGPVDIDGVRDLIKVYLYALIQTSECQQPNEPEGSFAAVELVMLYPGETYLLSTLIDQGVVRPAGPNGEHEYLCLIYDTAGSTATRAWNGGFDDAPPLPPPPPPPLPPEPPCLWEIGMLEGLVTLADPPLPTGGVVVGQVPVSFAGHDDLEEAEGVRTFLRHPSQAIGDVVAAYGELDCLGAEVPCPLAETTVTLGIGVTQDDSLPGPDPFFVIDGGPAAAVLIPFDGFIGCLPDCPPAVSSLAGYTCE